MMISTTAALRQTKGFLGILWSSYGKTIAHNNYSTNPPPSSTSSTAATTTSSSKENEPIRKSVFISQSYDIFTNLALEDWIYKNYDFGNHHILMLWLNDPCVVIGRHQNPFTETNVCQLEAAGIELARRNSGGGTVYHDRNNLNCTFFTPRERYDRKYNLNLITRAIYREYGIDTEIGPRDDILLHGKKVSIPTSLYVRLFPLVTKSINLLCTPIASGCECDCRRWEHVRNEIGSSVENSYSHTLARGQGDKLKNNAESFISRQTYMQRTERVSLHFKQWIMKKKTGAF